MIKTNMYLLRMLILNRALMKMKTRKTKSGVVIWRHKFNQLLHPLYVTFVCILLLSLFLSFFLSLFSHLYRKGWRYRKTLQNPNEKEGIKKHSYLIINGDRILQVIYMHIQILQQLSQPKLQLEFRTNNSQNIVNLNNYQQIGKLKLSASNG